MVIPVLKADPYEMASENESRKVEGVACRSMAFHSEWSDPIGGLVPPDLQRHNAFVSYASLIAEDYSPYLLNFLAGCSARVLVGPRIFSFDLPGARGKWVDIPELAERLQLLPWAEPGEAIN